jgi:hypothetical protein
MMHESDGLFIDARPLTEKGCDGLLPATVCGVTFLYRRFAPGARWEGTAESALRILIEFGRWIRNPEVTSKGMLAFDLIIEGGAKRVAAAEGDFVCLDGKVVPGRSADETSIVGSEALASGRKRMAEKLAALRQGADASFVRYDMRTIGEAKEPRFAEETNGSGERKAIWDGTPEALFALAAGPNFVSERSEMGKDGSVDLRMTGSDGTGDGRIAARKGDAVPVSGFVDAEAAEAAREREEAIDDSDGWDDGRD